jgi:hypothetical protein
MDDRVWPNGRVVHWSFGEAASVAIASARLYDTVDGSAKGSYGSTLGDVRCLKN